MTSQTRCRCKKQTVFVCSVCINATDPDQKQFWFCNPTTVEGSECFAKHVHAKHREMNRNLFLPDRYMIIEEG